MAIISSLFRYNNITNNNKSFSIIILDWVFIEEHATHIKARVKTYNAVITYRWFD